MAALTPIWAKTPDAAKNTRAYIEAVLDVSRVRGHRSGDNPARWRGHLDHLLPKQQKLTRGHHAAMPFDQVPAFVACLRSRDAVAARALEFLILTASRSGEVLGAQWTEMDFATGIWTLPANRTKSGREHRVPLSPEALDLVLEGRRSVGPNGEHVFPGQKAGRPLSNMAMEMLLRRLGKENVTVHGFRSSFRDWAGEVTEYSRELAELALAHQIGDETERAYRRQDALERRRPMMVDWAAFCRQATQAAAP